MIMFEEETKEQIKASRLAMLGPRALSVPNPLNTDVVIEERESSEL